MIGYWIAGAAIAAAAAWVWSRSRAAGTQGKSKVVRMNAYRSRKGASGTAAAMKPGSQLCSSCRKPAGRLSFYSDENGRVVGLCRECKPSAERRQLDRL
ncbi:MULTISPECIES: hypothetical protein [unclassified Paenibacillus]|uniref:hypothetical protein n=1 Tax=unclassified Paenibacillus TaxID=185978 RepID=UPI000954AEAB|nr:MULTISPECIES: hypothetical protein [unclassified Paenibacillus]ASS65510.1 hypothetical protein CIC07_04740 [Paenibacillus sp. RUD330]SIQ33761.1 hypothetical protein SAMN05880555_1414 [Paenibacillus sp. RU4X]SIQ55447.1 hypothetical protein SAMN05880570_1412 [Paenibacillus sp. RU4T]